MNLVETYWVWSLFFYHYPRRLLLDSVDDLVSLALLASRGPTGQIAVRLYINTRLILPWALFILRRSSSPAAKERRHRLVELAKANVPERSQITLPLYRCMILGAFSEISYV